MKTGRLAVLFTLLFSISPLCAAQFIRGDVDGSGAVEITDAVRLLGFLFLGDPGDLDCDDAADVDDQGDLTLSDAVSILNFLFNDGTEPGAPFPECGNDPSADSLDCVLPSCESSVVILRDDVVVLPDDTVPLSLGGGELLIESAGDLQLTAGEVLVSSSGEGLLGRIISVDPAPGGSRVTLAPATLEEIFEEASIAHSQTLRFDDIASIDLLSDGVTITRPDGAFEAGGAGRVETTFRLQFEYPPDSDEPPNGEPELGIDLDAHVTLGFDFDLQPRFLGLQSAEVSGRIEVGASATLSVSREWRFERTFRLATIRGRPLRVAVTPFLVIPVVPVYEISLALGGDGSVAFELTRSVDASARAGLHWGRDTGLRPIREVEANGAGGCPALAGAVRAEIALRPEFELLILGLAGGFVRLEAPKLVFETELRGEGTAEADVSLKLVAEGEVGLTISNLGRNLRDLGLKPEVFFELTLFEETYSILDPGDIDSLVGTWRKNSSEGRRFALDGTGAHGLFLDGRFVDAEDFTWAIEDGDITIDATADLRESVLSVNASELVVLDDASCETTRWARVTPSVTIVSPVEGQEHPVGDPLRLVGQTTGAVPGDLTLQWLADGAFVGAGLEITSLFLREGSPQIELRLLDPDESVVAIDRVTIEIVAERPPETVSVQFDGQSPGATRITFTDGSFQIIDWNLAVELALDGRLLSSGDDRVRYRLTRKRGTVRFRGTVEDHPNFGGVNLLEFDRTTRLDLESENGTLEIDLDSGRVVAFDFTVETVQGRSFYPRRVRYECRPGEETVGVVMEIDFPDDITPYLHEFAFGCRGRCDCD